MRAIIFFLHSHFCVRICGRPNDLEHHSEPIRPRKLRRHRTSTWYGEQPRMRQAFAKVVAGCQKTRRLQAFTAAIGHDQSYAMARAAAYGAVPR
ncbi:hypothetical protein BDU57DRAFT_513595 [Ampelomyces quisqualis]|uniref:Uncharacterized protein n=1 Tax=Ampelomyces quisqualis TaxID=50730 RepID=A0A6A5QRV9_AMPQU|nr:hypothetical protein BDU57DRAFT_513595 [Ampelomyces quisqualis]